MSRRIFLLVFEKKLELGIDERLYTVLAEVDDQLQHHKQHDELEGPRTAYEPFLDSLHMSLAHGVQGIAQHQEDGPGGAARHEGHEIVPAEVVEYAVEYLVGGVHAVGTKEHPQHGHIGERDDEGGYTRATDRTQPW